VGSTMRASSTNGWLLYKSGIGFGLIFAAVSDAIEAEISRMAGRSRERNSVPIFSST